MVSRSEPAKRVLVTGGHGFTGRYVCDELAAAGYDVIGTAMSPVPGSVALDIASPEACRYVIESQRPDYVVHLAAISFVAHANTDAFYRVNVVGTSNLLQACHDADHTPEKILVASSANVYGNTAGGELREDQRLQPVNHYGASKAAMEYIVATWFDKLPVVITRPFNYTGRGQGSQFLVPKIVEHFRQRQARIELGNLDVMRDFSDVRMVAQAYRVLLEGPSAGEIVHICSGVPYALRDVIKTLEQLAGYEIEVAVNPAFVRANEVKVLIGSPEKLNRLVPDLIRPAFEDTLRWMYEA
ncbi:NAD-dependent epimerase/dehydratase family protein [Cupriavidus sp. L7L]|uniref:NAD-dependent epimerase/dehydratase family protein n=1 Tax=Cupriavidus sp. L7L TaxID=2546443 RepID=UPI001055466C|nr:NAD-dependent epimerase/dehydratase family protein [Cupriavidus sp. L7L]TDF67702.1 NAD-dependent epimerase/dehydratase family protein [Cupriavidus sp. L7L]